MNKLEAWCITLGLCAVLVWLPPAVKWAAGFLMLAVGVLALL